MSVNISNMCVLLPYLTRKATIPNQECKIQAQQTLLSKPVASKYPSELKRVGPLTW